MRALTVQQPWAWAIFHGKDVENRTQAWTYRGPLLIHAGARLSQRGFDSPLIAAAQRRAGLHVPPVAITASAIIGVVILSDAHYAERGCCDSPWAEQSYVEHGGRKRTRIAHLVLEHPSEFGQPIPCRGALGLWTLAPDVAAEVMAAIR